MEAQVFFKEKATGYGNLHQQLSQQTLRVATLRVVLFVIALVAAIYYINQRSLDIALTIVLVFLLVFALLVRWHNRLQFKRQQYAYLQQINQEELQRLAHNFAAIDGGLANNTGNHPFADDLDIIGDHSVYQMLNRTSTVPGSKLLAERLLAEGAVADLQSYQQSVRELARMADFCQQYQALGRHVDSDDKDFARFDTWLQTAPRLQEQKYLPILAWLLPALFVIGFVTVTVLSITYYALLPLVIINLVVLGKQHHYAVKVVEQTARSINMLKSFRQHIDLITNQQFKERQLTGLAEKFSKEGDAGKEIARIISLLEQLQARSNIFHVFINVPFLLDLQWLLRLEKWHIRHRNNIREWFATFAEFEVLVSLAGQAFAHPGWCYPQSDSQAYKLSATGLGHPLIPAESRVVNDFAMAGKGQVILLTGPNMAGKSTFLRTVAVNVILARMGGVVCARQFAFNPEMQVFTAMRIKDDLSESVSSFYAELSRIKQLLALVHEGKPVLYFLDEILKGTNSADRHKGAEALIKQLSELQVSGFVSTHDLELGALATELASVRNYSFESIIDEGKINFDYKIRQGICTSFNACELMRQMGIKV